MNQILIMRRRRRPSSGGLTDAVNVATHHLTHIIDERCSFKHRVDEDRVYYGSFGLHVHEDTAALLDNVVRDLQNEVQERNTFKRRLVEDRIEYSDASLTNSDPCSPYPVEVFCVPIQKQYIITLRALRCLSKPQRESKVDTRVRVMGTRSRQKLYFVAKDMCPLIYLRKGSLSYATHGFTNDEKLLMPVMCSRRGLNVGVQVFTVLTIAGLKRLFRSSRCLIAMNILQWLLAQCTRMENGLSIDTSSFPTAIN